MCMGGGVPVACTVSRPFCSGMIAVVYPLFAWPSAGKYASYAHIKQLIKGN